MIDINYHKMSEKRLTKISRFLSYHLRHAPEKLGLELQPGGWVSVVKLLKAAHSRQFPITLTELERVVQQNEKKRFSFDETKTKIRANQGHSVTIDLQLIPLIPPPILYHGTHRKAVKKILKEGLKKMSRHHVHLSDNKETASQVGARRGKPVIFQVNAQQMTEDSLLFYCSDNNVWLVDYVAPQYLSLLG
ncbi:MAG: RNA 2'-phosphotransferase [Microcystaceae cyanobacterium]